MNLATKYQKIITSGKRKTSVAKAILTSGDGKITINNKDYKTFHPFDVLKIEEPLRIYENVMGKPDFKVEITVKGGGEKSQIEAARLSLAKAMVSATNSKELKDAFISYDRNMIVADVRRKEACKPGDSKARAKRQSSKR